ncbi:MAG TPA: FtsX-like permease family protein [Blastocatellia bacterium]|nr:FtsX-like permease family protein [Blastocatellia bacterium]
MKFVISLAFREMRSSWHRLLVFFICIAIGVGSIVCLRSLVQNIKFSVGRESRSLLTADVQVSSNNSWNAETRAAFEAYYHSPLVADHTEVLETTTMLRPLNNAKASPKMVELKAVQGQFPFYGEMLLSGGTAYSHELLKGRGILVKPSLLSTLNLKVGDRVRIGSTDFMIRGAIDREPGNALTSFGLAPRVMVDYDDAIAAGLSSTFGSRVRYRVLFKTRENGMDPLLGALQNDLKAQRLVTVRSSRYSQDRLSESLTQVEDYLSLIGLVILVLGGIGISSVTRVFIQQKMKTIAILKCLGGKNPRVLGAYLTQVLALGLSGSLLGLVLAWAATVWVPRYLADQLPFNVEFGLTWQASLQGLGVGLLISLLFSIVPLLEIRQIKPILVLRSLTGVERPRFDWLKIVTGLLVAVGLLAVASWQGGSLKIGGIFLGSLAAMTIILHLAATVLMKFLGGLRHKPSFVWRQGISSLYRPGNQTRIIVMAVGLGVFCIVGVRSLQLNLRSEFSLDLDAVRADLYMIDIQKDQRAGVEEIVAGYTGSKPPLIPTVRARISRISTDEQVPHRSNPNGTPAREQRGMFSREYVLTYRPYLEDYEKILDGKFWDPTPSSEPEVSIEEMLHDELDLNVGDLITFDVQGPKITARVTSIRRVDWRNARTGFFIVFRPGVLEQAPAMYITAIKGPAPGEPRAQMQRELVDRYPNVSVVDVLDIIEIARSIVQNISLAVSFVGGFIFLSGLLILIGSIAMTKFHRLYESAILKTLGAKRKLIVCTILVEYGVLGLLAGALGSSAAIGLSWIISKYILKISWQFTPAVNLTGALAALILVTVVGVLSSWDVMIRKPLGILRSE